MDSRLKVNVLNSTPSPNLTCWCALHQDYSEKYIAEEISDNSQPGESKAGEIIVKKLLGNDRGHYGPLEHVSITFAVGYFPHSVMQQARTHRIGISFDCQSFRYTGDRLVKAANWELPIEDVVYLRPVGYYGDREGAKFHYTESMRQSDLRLARVCLQRYAENVNTGMPKEQARSLVPFDVRQHFVASFSARSLMHFLDLRAKADAQEEIRWLCELMLSHFEEWMPEVCAWYKKSRYSRARLAP